MHFIDMTPAWDWNDPTRTICIETKVSINWHGHMYLHRILVTKFARTENKI